MEIEVLRQAYTNNIEWEVASASPLELTLIIYREAIQSVEQAIASVSMNDAVGRSKAITKATLLVHELVTSVNKEVNPELAGNLIELYDFVLRKLTQGNVEQSDKPLIEAVRVLTTLADAWRQVNSTEAAAVSASAGSYVPVSCTA